MYRLIRNTAMASPKDTPVVVPTGAPTAQQMRVEEGAELRAPSEGCWVRAASPEA